MMKRLLQNVLALLARLFLWRYRPLVVGVTGSVGKTSAKGAIFAVLAERSRVRKSEGNYNTEIGVPLTILGARHYGKNVFGWAFAFARALFRLVFRDSSYPEILVLEMGADRPGDIAYLARLAPPAIGVVTAVGEAPVHVEFFSGTEELASEKAKLIKAVPREGYAILNGDDPRVRAMAQSATCRVLTYGFGSSAEVRIGGYGLRIVARHDGTRSADGMRFTLTHQGESAAVALRNTFGRPQAYAAAAAAGVAIALGRALPEIARALGRYESPPGRLKLIAGNKGTQILDDTYNASPAAVRAALEVLREFPASRRIAVLGDMLELGVYTEEAHRAAGEAAAEGANVFIAVGERMKFALEALPSREDLLVFWCAESREAGQKLDQLLRPGDAVLVKGSQAMRMERVVEEVMAEPERAEGLLVRQDRSWRRR